MCTIFMGEQSEQLLLEQWILREHCRLVNVLGMGGIGKSALAITLMHEIAPAFQVVIFRSVRDAPPCQDLLVDCLQIFAPEPLPTMPANIERRLDLLLECLQKYRCLLVLDNLEFLLQEHDAQGHYLPGFEEYGVLLQPGGRNRPPELSAVDQSGVSP